MRRALLAGLLALAACGGGAPESDAETVLLVLVDELAPADLAAPGATWDPMPHVTALAAAGESVADVLPAPLGRSAFAASVLTGVSPERHGLRSTHELGAERLGSDVPTVAGTLQAQGWETLASVVPAHWRVQGLDRGFDRWTATEEGRPARDARAVVDALAPELERALASPRDALVFLHFADLRTEAKVEPDAATLEHYLGEWRGTGGVVDEAFADKESEESLATRLAKALLRRKHDPRREALLRAQRAARLAAIDAQLGRVLALVRESGRETKVDVWVCGWRRPVPVWTLAEPEQPVALVRRGEPNAQLPHFADRAALGPWVETPWESGTSVQPPAQHFRMRCAGRAPQDVQVDPVKPDTASWTSRGSVQNLSPGGSTSTSLPRRGQPLRLVFEDPELPRIPLASMVFGEGPLTEVVVPELVAQRSPEWPENALVGPLLDLQKSEPRRMRGVVDAPAGAAVEVLLESLPVDPALPDGVRCPDGEVAADPLRPGAVWVRGTGPLAFDFPTRGPGARLAVLCRVDGERVDHSRMRYLDRVLGAPDRLELLLGAGAWLDPALRAAPPEDAALGLQLVDGLPLPDSIALPSRAELSALRRLDPDE